MNGFINMDENKTDEKDVITSTKEAVTESDSTNNIAEVTDTENIENQEDEDEVKKEEENNKETEKDDIPSNKNKPNETENSDPKSQDKEFSTEKEDPVSNKFLQRFSSLSKSINTNPAVVRAGIVLQTAAAQGIIPTRVNQNASSSSDDEYIHPMIHLWNHPKRKKVNQKLLMKTEKLNTLGVITSRRIRKMN